MKRTRQHKSRKGEERKSSRQLNETLFVCFFELSGVFYLYRDFVIVLEKITIAVTLMDKTKMEPSH